MPTSSPRAVHAVSGNEFIEAMQRSLPHEALEAASAERAVNLLLNNCYPLTERMKKLIRQYYELKGLSKEQLEGHRIVL